jgi:hypothetical protein
LDRLKSFWHWRGYRRESQDVAANGSHGNQNCSQVSSNIAAFPDRIRVFLGEAATLDLSDIPNTVKEKFCLSGTGSVNCTLWKDCSTGLTISNGGWTPVASNAEIDTGRNWNPRTVLFDRNFRDRSHRLI